MPNTSVQANATALPVETPPRVLPSFGPLRALSFPVGTKPHDPFLDFEADDSGARNHQIPCDAYEEFLVAFRAMTAGPFSDETMRTDRTLQQRERPAFSQLEIAERFAPMADASQGISQKRERKMRTLLEMARQTGRTFLAPAECPLSGHFQPAEARLRPG